MTSMETDKLITALGRIAENLKDLGYMTNELNRILRCLERTETVLERTADTAGRTEDLLSDMRDDLYEIRDDFGGIVGNIRGCQFLKVMTERLGE